MSSDRTSRSLPIAVELIHPPREITGQDVRALARTKRARRAAALSVAVVLAATAIFLGSNWLSDSSGGSTSLSAVGGSLISGGQMRQATLPLPSDGWRPGQLRLLAFGSGRLHMTRTSKGACAWFGTRRHNVLWPAGFEAHFHPDEILDSRGAVVAKEGQRVYVGGGWGAVAARKQTCESSTNAFYVTGPVSTS